MDSIASMALEKPRFLQVADVFWGQKAIGPSDMRYPMVPASLHLGCLILQFYLESRLQHRTYILYTCQTVASWMCHPSKPQEMLFSTLYLVGGLIIPNIWKAMF